MRAYLVHHAPAVGPEVDPQRPLSTAGHEIAAALAGAMASRGVAPQAIWHSGKLRARQTAEALLQRSPFAEFKMVRGLRPDDAPEIVAIALAQETRDIAVVGHFPQLDQLCARLTGGTADGSFPLHGVIALEEPLGLDETMAWREVWRWTISDAQSGARSAP